MRIFCAIRYIELDGDYGAVDSVEATCPRCGACEDSYGTDDASIRRCLLMLNQNCERDEDNFYIADPNTVY